MEFIQCFSLFQVQCYIKNPKAEKKGSPAIMNIVLESDLESSLSSASHQLCLALGKLPILSGAPLQNWESSHEVIRKINGDNVSKSLVLDTCYLKILFIYLT